MPFSLENEIIYIICAQRKITDTRKLRKNNFEIRLLRTMSITAKITATKIGTKKHCGKSNNNFIIIPPIFYIIIPLQWSISCCII